MSGMEEITGLCACTTPPQVGLGVKLRPSGVPVQPYPPSYITSCFVCWEHSIHNEYGLRLTAVMILCFIMLPLCIMAEGLEKLFQELRVYWEFYIKVLVFGT